MRKIEVRERGWEVQECKVGKDMMPFLERLVTVGLLGKETSEPELERGEEVTGVDI